MTILITRPSPDGEQLARQLSAAGYPAIAQPLLDIAPGHELPNLPQQLETLKNGDFLIAVSVNAANLAHNYLMSIGVSWPKNVHYIAVGQKTAEAMKCHTGQQVHTPLKRSDSEGLLALPVLSNVNQRRVLILRGNGGRELIREQLASDGADVSYCEAYQRCWLPLDGEVLSQKWQQVGVNAIVVTSGEQLDRLAQLIPDSATAWFLQCQLFVPSQRIADQAAMLGFHLISNVNSAANGPLFTTLSNKGTMG